MTQSQKQIIVGKLRKEGYISRNWCLSQFISRLSAIILTLKKEGWDLEGKDVNGDYIYTVTKSKYPKMQIVEVNGERVARMI